jgi:hypothetical protein
MPTLDPDSFDPKLDSVRQIQKDRCPPKEGTIASLLLMRSWYTDKERKLDNPPNARTDIQGGEVEGARRCTTMSRSLAAA